MVKAYTNELVCPQVQQRLELVYPQVRHRSKFTLVSFVGHVDFGGVEEQRCGVGGRIWQLSSN